MTGGRPSGDSGALSAGGPAAPAPGGGAESATARLSRLLAMVPWLLAHQGVGLADAARRFGVTEPQLVRDLELLFVCGTPGGMPDDLIEADWESGQVFVGNADTIARPLRLTLDETVPLLVGLRALTTDPAITERDAALRALAKLEAAAGPLGAVANLIEADIADPGAADTLDAARSALREHRRLHLAYFSVTRDEVTERDVDPMRLESVGSRWYLQGWCHLARAVRIFRLDRVQRLQVLAADGTPPPGAVARELSDEVFEPAEGDVRVVLDLATQARWMAEYYPSDEVHEGADGHLRVHLRTSDTEWLCRLVLRSGGAVAVVDPPELTERVRAVAAAALTAYDGGSDAAT